MKTLQECYRILGLPMDSNHQNVKKAYKRLALSNHPDRGGDAERFQEISNAYNQIINPSQTTHSPDFSEHQYFNSHPHFQFVFNSNLRNFTSNANTHTHIFTHSASFKPKVKISSHTSIVNGVIQTQIRETDLNTGRTTVSVKKY